MEMTKDKENQEKSTEGVSLLSQHPSFLNLQTLIARSIKRCGDLHV